MKPILFNTNMVRAILDGRKTETRRVINPQPSGKAPMYCYAGSSRKYVGRWNDMSGQWWTPPFHTGDVLYVRETFRERYASSYSYDEPLDDWTEYEYMAGGDTIARGVTHDTYITTRSDWSKWKPSVHMPKEAARIFLRVTDVRVERLHEITDAGAKAEGANYADGKNVGWEEKIQRSAIERFAEIWDSTVKKPYHPRYGWDANPWVWVISFARTEATECEG